MTIEEFRKLYKSTDDIKALVDSHVEVKNFKACFEYYDHFISYDFSKAFIKALIFTTPPREILTKIPSRLNSEKRLSLK